MMMEIVESMVWWIAAPAMQMSAPSMGMPKGITTSPSGIAWSGKPTRKRALGNDMPFFTARAVATLKRMWVEALAATTGPKVAMNPMVEATPTRAATAGPATIESMTGTWEAKVAEYPTAGITNWRVPRKRRGIAKARAARTPPKATSTLLRAGDLHNAK